MEIPDRLSCRRAIEALRNGVPNREAVRILGSTQPHAEQRFRELLDRAADGAADGTMAQTGRGMLISGDFGTGKSHLLEHFEHIALDHNFICSRVAVSKETPFYDLGKMFRAATDNGTTPGGTVGIMVDEIGTRLAGSQSAGYARFFTWANEADNGLHRVFPATLLVHERLPDQEVCNEIRGFWSGDKLAVSTVKNGLRQLQQQGAYAFRAPKLKDLPPQRLRFVLEMAKAAGYRGWVVLIDELELIGSYSVLQRARSYAELARWMGDTGEDYPGLVVVAAITEDFAEAILEEKGDRIKVPDRMRGRGDEQIAQQAETGMRWIEGRQTPLHEVTPEAVEAAVDTIRRIYRAAYDWDAPPATTPAGAGYQRRMRYKVRSAITAWDLQRLHPDSRPELESDEYRTSYTEDPDLEVEAKDDEPTS